MLRISPSSSLDYLAYEYLTIEYAPHEWSNFNDHIFKRRQVQAPVPKASKTTFQLTDPTKFSFSPLSSSSQAMSSSNRQSEVYSMQLNHPPDQPQHYHLTSPHYLRRSLDYLAAHPARMVMHHMMKTSIAEHRMGDGLVWHTCNY